MCVCVFSVYVYIYVYVWITNKPAACSELAGWMSDSWLSCCSFWPEHIDKWERTVFVFVTLTQENLTNYAQWISNTILYLCAHEYQTPERASITSKRNKPREKIPFFSNATWKANMEKSNDLSRIFKRLALSLWRWVRDSTSGILHDLNKQSQEGDTFCLK